MGREKNYRPVLPTDVTASFHDGVLGSMRSRTVGEPRRGVPEIVIVQGMTVSDYLLPGVGALSSWTRVHLIDLPGCSGSGEPPHELSVTEFAASVADWLDSRRLGPVILAGHSSGTQVAAETARRRPRDIVGVVLAGPTVDPIARGPVRVFARWWADRRGDPKSLDEVHKPERKRVGFRRLFHVLREHLRHDLEQPVAALTMPVLVIRGRDDRLSTPQWGRRVAALAGGSYIELPGTHSFCWRYPQSWSPPIQDLAGRVSRPSSAQHHVKSPDQRVSGDPACS
ncbi:alpha/beta hydrolase [Actinoplanes sp. NPDC051411]|uniref:alpha/beta fold hydrolase n=1 Tax=Actinoplanes sp. NPDC051411 TaxID=3155522 RepID=UPI0034425DA9